MKEIIKKLTLNKKTISTMESCTGGLLANSITNIEGASIVFNYGAVTYSNDFKIKLGVPKKIIEKFTVYSEETAQAMAKAISLYANSNYGIGVTGKLKRADNNNPRGNDNIVYISIYNQDTDSFNTFTIEVTKDNRIDNKNLIVNKIIKELKIII